MFVTAEDAMERTGLSLYMLQNYGPPCVRKGRRVFWRSVDLDAMINESDDVRPKDRIAEKINGLSANEIR